MNILKAFGLAIAIFFGFVIMWIVAWAFVAGLTAAGTYSLEPFYMLPGEWSAAFRVISYLYGLAIACVSIGLFVDVVNSPQ